MRKDLDAAAPTERLDRRPRSLLLRRMPAFAELADYSWRKFAHDLLAGLTVATVAVPQGMAYAAIFHVPVQYGLYTAIVMCAIGALANGSRHLINGPTNAISIAMLSALSFISYDQQPQAYIAAAILMSVLVGAIQLAVYTLKLGDLSRYISTAVIVGFTAGASIILFLDQLKNALGLSYKTSAHEHFVKRTALTLWYGGPIHWPTFTLAAVTILSALLIRAINRRFRVLLPELLLAIVFAVGLLFVAGWQTADSGVALVGAIPRTLPSWDAPHVDLQMVSQLSASALAIATLGLLEAIAMAKSLAAKTGQKLDVNQQCFSEGIANFCGGFFQCIPGSGSLTRSYINYTAGAKTQWSGIIAAIAVAATILVAAPLAAYIPKAALAGVLLLTATRMIDPVALRFHWRATGFDRIILVATAAAAIFISIEFCILIGVLLSFVLYVPRAGRIEMREVTITSDRVFRELQPGDRRCDRFRIYNFEGEMFFGCGPQFESLLESIAESSTEEARVVLLRCKRLRNPDAASLELLQTWVQRMQSRSVIILMSGVRPELLSALRNVGLTQLIGDENVFAEQREIWASTMAAMRRGYELLGDERCEHCPNRVAEEDWTYMI